MSLLEANKIDTTTIWCALESPNPQLFNALREQHTNVLYNFHHLRESNYSLKSKNA